MVLSLGLAVLPIFWFAGQEGVPVFKHFPTLMHEYQRDRVKAIFSNDPKSSGGLNYQQDHALMALGSGGITGKGIGEVPIGRRVPEGHNDMIFSLIGEQFGFFGSAVVLAAYIVLFAAGIEISASTREPFGRLIALGIVAILAGQTFVNIMVTVKLMPVTGITLPFISYGGSSLLASFMAAGLLLNVGQNRPIVMANNSFEFEEEE